MRYIVSRSDGCATNDKFAASQNTASVRAGLFLLSLGLIVLLYTSLCFDVIRVVPRSLRFAPGEIPGAERFLSFCPQQII